MPITLDIQGIPEVQKLLNKLHGRSLKGVMGTISEGVGRELANTLREYPARRYGAKQVWKSERQRRWFFAALRSGAIRVPYIRTMDLGRSWAVERKGSGAVVGTKVLYAPYVQSSEKQTEMHRRTGWVTDEKAAEKVSKSGAIQRIANMVVSKVLG